MRLETLAARDFLAISAISPNHLVLVHTKTANHSINDDNTNQDQRRRLQMSAFS